MLTVSTPALKQNGLAQKPLVSEKAIQLECSSVKFPDGTLVTPENVIDAGFFMQRRQLGGGIESWDQIARQWTSPSKVLNPEPLFYKDNLWQSLIVAIGQKDKLNQEDKFATNRLIGFPQYLVQCVFKARDLNKQEHTGISAGSLPVQIIAAGGTDRAGLYLKPKMEPSSAKEIGIFLKDEVLVAEQGRISIKEEGGGFLIEVVCSGSRIEISPSGEIVLRPKPGQPVRIAGNLSIGGALNIDGPVSIDNTLNVSGIVTAPKVVTLP